MVTTVVAGHRDVLRRADEALHQRGSLRDSRELHTQAYRLAQTAGDAEAMAAAALGIGGLWVHEHRAAHESAQVEARQRRGLTDLAPDSPLGVRLRIRLAAEADYRVGTTAGVAAALKLARRADDPVALADALSLAHHCLLGPQHVGVRMRLASELLRVGFLTGRRVDVLMGLLWSTVDRLLAGDPMADRSLAELRDALASDGCSGHAAIGYVLHAIDVMLALRAGRLDDAESLAALCLTAGQQVGDADALAWYAGQLAAVRWYQGRTAELVPQLEQLAGATETGAIDRSSYAALAVGYAAAGDHTRAACALARVRGRDFTDMVRGSSWLTAMYAAVEAAYLLGDADTARAAYDVLEPYADLPVVLSLGIACFGSTHHVLGVAALSMAEPDRAVTHLRAAVRANQALGNLPATAWSRQRLAEALRARDGSGDLAEADAESDRAQIEARALGLTLPQPQSGPTGPTPLITESPLSATVSESRLQTDEPATGRPAAGDVAVTRHTGGVWEVRAHERTITVPDALGVRYLAILVARPGDEVEAIELARAVSGSGAPAADPSHGPARDPVLDARALREYRARLASLDTRIAHADPGSNEAKSAQQERDWLVTELSHATGLGGRVRSFTHDTERARIAVTKAVRRSLERIGEVDPLLGEELSARVRTGVRCCFDPR